MLIINFSLYSFILCRRTPITKSFTKSLVLMVHPGDRTVPLQHRKFRMYENGNIIDAVSIDIGKSEEDMINDFQQLFKNKLDGAT